ncbi:MAG: glycosyltransferase family 39 protein [Dysgonamonadaceae bacterium]|jgi:4-amino-4-deoxy-L-arabinose transferase-like glycosyltransferase|nr:glycosyltransferase family 39 protein [Dysgonamonadaceae bacterium]
MLPERLHSLYANNPVLLLVVICFLTVVLWIGAGEFYTKGEPREASVAASILERGEWVLPEVYAGERAYKPPLTHWLTAVFSTPCGKVSPFTSRLPSALAFTGMIVAVFLFYRRYYRKEVAFFTCIILLTCFELHRAAMTSRVDMTLTSLTVLAFILLFGWERKQLKGFPMLIAIVMSGATLTKGPVGIFLPMLVFGVYLLVLRYSLTRIVLKLLPVAVASLVLPLVWYYFAYLEGGRPFLDLVWAENFGRLLGQKDLPVNYALGHEEGWWYNFLSLAAGFLPWTLLLFTSVKGLRNTTLSGVKERLIKIRSDRPMLFSLIAAVVTVGFYCIPLSKRSVYLMPAYPFIAVFISGYVMGLRSGKTLLYRITAVYIVLWIAIDAIALPIYKNSITQKPFAEHIQRKYPALKQNIYAMNNLLEYSNMYGVNFYLGGSLRDFEKCRPDEGYLLVGGGSFERVAAVYGGSYLFERLESYSNMCRDGEKEILLVSFGKK